MAETWKCGHPRTPENTAPVGGKKVTCRTCRRAWQRQWAENNPVDPVANAARSHARETREARMVRLYAEGQGKAAIARELGSTRGTVRAILKRHGLS